VRDPQVHEGRLDFRGRGNLGGAQEKVSCIELPATAKRLTMPRWRNNLSFLRKKCKSFDFPQHLKDSFHVDR
jgi:hypothetical protein